MCGIFGYVGETPADPDRLFDAAQAGRRGPHAHGWVADGEITRRLGPLDPHLVPNSPTTILGHARLATYGNPRDQLGIQPIIVGGHAVVHNGNVDNWRTFVSIRVPSDSWVIAMMYHRHRPFYDDPAPALAAVIAQLNIEDHAVVILDADGSLVASHAGLPLHHARTTDGVYVSSMPFADSLPVPEHDVRCLGRTSRRKDAA